MLRHFCGGKRFFTSRAPTPWKRYSFLVVGRTQRLTFFSLVLFLAPCTGVSAASLEENPTRALTKTSEFSQNAADAWNESGIRIGLSYEFNALLSMGYQPHMITNGFSLRPHYRMSNDWGLGASITYGVPLTNNTGLRWALTVEGTWWVVDQLGLSLGLGYAGLMIECGSTDVTCVQTLPNNAGARPEEDQWLQEGERLSGCTGGGPTVTTRIDYNIVISTFFGTGPYLQTYFQAVRCGQETGRSHAETGQRLQFYDTWSYFGATLGWWFTWR